MQRDLVQPWNVRRTNEQVQVREATRAEMSAIADSQQESPAQLHEEHESAPRTLLIGVSTKTSGARGSTGSTTTRTPRRSGRTGTPRRTTTSASELKKVNRGKIEQMGSRRKIPPKESAKEPLESVLLGRTQLVDGTRLAALGQ